MDFALEALQLRGDVPCLGIAKAQKTQKPFFFFSQALLKLV